MEFFINEILKLKRLLIWELSNKEWLEFNITYFLNLSKASCP
jgi:hypothetical protein